MYQYLECGLKDVWLDNGYTVKQTFFGGAIAIYDVDLLHKTIGLNLVNSKFRLSGSEIRFLRKEMNISQKILGETLNVSEADIRDWEDNKEKPSESLEKLLRLLYVAAWSENIDIEVLKNTEYTDREDFENRINFKYSGSLGGWSKIII